jgi:NADPH:quinone reductase-like Zn-dependent oxidoreductase
VRRNLAGGDSPADHPLTLVAAATPAACTDVVLSSEFDGWIADPANAPDVVIDPVGGELRATAFGHLAPFGRQIILGNASGDDRPLPGDGAWHGSRTLSGLSPPPISWCRRSRRLCMAWST